MKNTLNGQQIGSIDSNAIINSDALVKESENKK